MKRTNKKYFAILLSIILMLGLSACKKEILLGTYYCAMHNIAFPPPSYPIYDTIIGYATISVYKSGTQIILNNETLNQVANSNMFVSPNASPNTEEMYYDNVTFTNNFDSIIYSYNYTKTGVESGTNSSYQGHKIN